MTTPSALPFSLTGQTALITGGGTGIGLGIARCMTQAGAQVVLVGRREAPLQAACAELGPRACYVAADITQVGQASALITAAEAAAKQPISILVNNAGTHLKKLAVDTAPEEFEAMLRTHVISAHALTRAIVPGMVERGRGSVLFTSSMAAFMGVPQVIAYAAAKSAFFGMVSTLSAELAAKGVRVNAIAPGWIFSEMTEQALNRDAARKAKVMGRIQIGRMGQPEDIGWAAVYLCSPAAGYVTGVTLPVDGGASNAF
jgi:NAD(P)-dependent dehydrogenase (short-subunit alcohol dehydrogenase family)